MTSTTYYCTTCDYERVLPESPHRDPSKTSVFAGCEECMRRRRFVWYRAWLLEIAFGGAY